jgi:hypothetical protein
VFRGGNFLTLEPGQSVEGFLVGVTQIKTRRGDVVDRWQLLLSGEPDPVILPQHYDLDQKLREVWDEGRGEGSLVWIAFLGKRKVAGVPQPMAVYRVVDYGKAGAPAPEAAQDEEVPF